MVPVDSTSSRNRLLWAVLLSLTGHGIVLFGAAHLIPAVDIPLAIGSLRVALTSAPAAVETAGDMVELKPPEHSEPAVENESVPQPAAEPLTEQTAEPTPVPASFESPAPGSSAAIEESTENNSVGSGTAAGEPVAAENGPVTVSFSTLAAGASLALPSYPATAKKWEQEGTVRVRILIAADGTVEAVELSESSGHYLLDEEVLQTIRRKWSFPPPGRQVVTQKSFTFRLSGS